MTMTPTTLAGGFVFLEGPRWRQGKLWVSDMHGFRVLTITPDGRQETVCAVPTQPSGLGWLPDGRLLVVSMVDRKVLRLDPGGLVVHADLSALATHHANDMVVDAQGRAYVGNFGWDFEAGVPPVPAVMALVHPDGRVEAAARDLLFPNGTVLLPDGRTLVVAETFAHHLTAFDVAPDGTLSNRRVWADLGDMIFPDGICLDAAGGIWVASPLSREAIRVVEGGAVTDRIASDLHVIACALGGDDGRTLFLCTAPAVPHLEARALHAARLDVVRVEHPSAGSP